MRLASRWSRSACRALRARAAQRAAAAWPAASRWASGYRGFRLHSLERHWSREKARQSRAKTLRLALDQR